MVPTEPTDEQIKLQGKLQVVTFGIFFKKIQTMGCTVSLGGVKGQRQNGVSPVLEDRGPRE